MRTSKVFTAQRAGDCHGCGTDVKGKRCRYHGHSLYHENCVPSGSRRSDSEYYAGIRDAERFREDRALFGDEAAERMEIERELRFGSDY